MMITIEKLLVLTSSLKSLSCLEYVLLYHTLGSIIIQIFFLKTGARGILPIFKLLILLILRLHTRGMTTMTIPITFVKMEILYHSITMVLMTSVLTITMDGVLYLGRAHVIRKIEKKKTNSTLVEIMQKTSQSSFLEVIYALQERLLNLK